jgi:hypothetical protein
MSYKSFSSGGSSASKKAQLSKEISQEDIDAIKDPSVENKICLSCDDYEFKGPLIIRANTTLTIPLGTTLKITDK